MTNGNNDEANWESVAFEAWKHYAAAGGADKDRMIQIATWLLGFSAAIVGFTFNAAADGTKLVNSVAAIGLSLIGMIISIACALITLIYGGYANRNWGRADRIAREAPWPRLARDDVPFPQPQGRSLVAWALRQSRPCQPAEELAPIFRLVFYFCVISFIVHLLVLGCSAWNSTRHEERGHTLTIQLTSLDRQQTRGGLLRGPAA